MTNLKSNIAYWTNFIGTRRDVSTSLRKSDHIEFIQQLNFAIDELKMHEEMIKDIADGRLVRNDDWDENRVDVIGQNGNTGDHYD